MASVLKQLSGGTPVWAAVISQGRSFGLQAADYCEMIAYTVLKSNNAPLPGGNFAQIQPADAKWCRAEGQHKS